MAYNNGNSENSVETQLDIIENYVAITANKLDADQYAADDIDGVTESLFGSGNMAYGVLQSSLVDVALMNSSPSSVINSNEYEGGNIYKAKSNFSNSDPDESGNPTYGYGDDAPTDNVRSNGVSDNYNEAEGDNANGSFTTNTVGSVSASQLSSNADGLDGTGGNGNNGNNGGDGKDGHDGSGEKTVCGNCCNDVNFDLGDLIINFGDLNLGDLNIDLGDALEILDGLVIDLGDTISVLVNEITDITGILGDVITNLGDLDLSNVIDLVMNLSDNLTSILNNVITEVSNVTGDITNILDLDLSLLDDLSTQIADLTGLDILSDVLAELGGTIEVLQDTTGQLINVVTDLDLADLDGTVEQLITVVGNLDLGLDGITDIVDETVGGILEDLGIGGDGSDGDGLISQTLDPVVGDEITDVADDLTGGLLDGLLGENNNNQDGSGDSDIVADLGIDLLNIDETLEAAIDPVEDLVGDIDLGLGLDLLGGGETDNTAGDSDLILNTDIDLVDNTILEGGLDVPLDPLEEVVGDVDLDIDAAVNLLGDIADPLVNDGEGGTGKDTLLNNIGETLEDIAEHIVGEHDDNAFEELTEGLGVEISDALGLLNNDLLDHGDYTDSDDDGSSWTESTIGEGGLFDDLIDGLGGADDALPDPVGTVAEGLGVLDVEPELDIGSLGGLFG